MPGGGVTGVAEGVIVSGMIVGVWEGVDVKVGVREGVGVWEGPGVTLGVADGGTTVPLLDVAVGAGVVGTAEAVTLGEAVDVCVTVGVTSGELRISGKYANWFKV